MKKLLTGHVVVWRNKLKHCLEYFMERFLFSLKELDVEGRHYLVFLEDFPDNSVVPRTFTVRTEKPGYGNYGDVRVNLLKTVEAIDKDIDLSSRVVMTAQDQRVEHPIKRRTLNKLVKRSETLQELDDGIELIGTATVEELIEEV